jgi:serine/threonine protein kinase
MSSQPISYSDNAWLKVSREAKSLIRKMLTRDPKTRASADELLQHEFFSDKIDSSRISNDLLLDINQNLEQYRKNSVFQTSVMAYIVHFNDSYCDLDTLREVFL